MKYLPLILLLTACGRGDFVADCVTLSGLESESDVWTCEDVQAGEDAAITALGRVFGEQVVRDTLAAGLWMQGRECISYNWGAYYYWINDEGKEVSGTYYSGNNGIDLCEVPIEKTAMLHEIAHAVENFTGYIHTVPDDHYMWEERGIDAATGVWRTLMRDRKEALQ